MSKYRLRRPSVYPAAAYGRIREETDNAMDVVALEAG
jgi:hypothetical protein